MEIKILQVFYDKNGLPYKDKERTVHYPITSGTFLGASNTTQIRFYYDELDELNESTFVAVSKLPNGKIGSEVLETKRDAQLEENYAVLNLSQFYTQYKGDVFISLQGYEGGVRVEQDENGIYSILGTPTIQATGSIRMYVAYAPTFIGSGETENITLQRVLAELSTKLGIRQETLYVEELPTVGNPNVWYVINDDPNDTAKANIYIWNATTQTYVWVGDNTLDLGNYYTQEQGEQFESGIDNRVSSVENELSSVAQGSPKGVYATLSDLESAYPTGTTGIYVVSANGHWYYWNGSAWTDGGAYLSAPADQYLNPTSTNAIQNQAVAEELKKITTDILKNKEIPTNSISWTDGYIYDNQGNVVGDGTFPFSISNEIDVSSRQSNFLLVRMSKQYSGSTYLAHIILLDDNHVFVSSISSIEDNAGGSGYLIIDVPDSVKYLKTSERTDDKNNFSIFNLTLDSIGYSRLNIVDKDDFEIGSINNQNGQDYAVTNWKRTKYIDISSYAGKNIIASLPNYATNNAGLAFYDKNKAYISGIAGIDGANIIYKLVKVPNNAAYIRFSLPNTFWEYACLMVTLNDIVNDFQKTKGIVETTYEETKHFFVNGTIQVINTENMSGEQGAVYTTDGTDFTTTTWTRTGYLDVSAFVGKKANISVPTFPTSLITAGSAFYDENKLFISGVEGIVDGTSSWKLKEITIPQNAKYVRISLRNTDFANTNLFISLDEFIEEHSNKIKEKSNLLISKNYDTPLALTEGIANQIIFDKVIDIDNVSCKAKITLTNNSSVVTMGSKDDLGETHASYIEFDFGNKQIKIYANGTGLTIPNSIIATESFSSLPTSTEFYIEVGRKERQLYAKITEYYSGQSVEKVVVEDDLVTDRKYKYPAGWLCDYPTLGLRAGGCAVNNYVVSIPRNVDFAFIGDSITEGFGIKYQDSWCYKAKQYFGNSVGMGRSGATIVISQKQVEDIISIMQPKYTVVTIGTNGGNNVSRLNKIIETIRKCNSIPIINCIVATSNTVSSVVNNEILSLKELLCTRFDVATSLNNDVEDGQNTLLFQADSIHPNEQGNVVMYDRLLQDIGNIKGE